MVEILVPEQTESQPVNHETCQDCGSAFSLENPAVFYPIGQYNLCRDCDMDNLDRSRKQLHRRKLMQALEYVE